MKIASWNVNGLRAVARKELLTPVFRGLSPDVLMVQETKASPQQLPECVRLMPGYVSYFNFPSEKRGYSGTGMYCNREPKEVSYGMGNDHFDKEGRLITVFFEDIIISNIYFPNGGMGPERLKYKLEFYECFLEYVNTLRKKNPVVWGGDINTAHEEIDLARPKENMDRTGFLPEERAWLDEVNTFGWIDTFRHFYPNKTGMYSYWDTKTGARDRNVGWRIDYLFISPDLLQNLKRASIHPEMFGSDHCPVSIELNVQT